MYRCEHFGIKELVCKETYIAKGNKAWALLDDRALMTLDALREEFGSITVNDWSWKGSSQYRGLRIPGTPYYSTYSQHSSGRAFDCVFKNISAEEVRVFIKANPDKFPYINSMEEGVSWLHFDVRNSEFLTFPKPIT